MSSFFSNLSQTYRDIVEDSVNRRPVVETKLYLLMCGAALVLFSVAGFGYLAHGYDWGFSTINGMTPLMSPIFLHNLTTFGDGIFVVALILFIANKNLPIIYTALIAAIVGGLVSQSLKRYFNADRPPAVLELEAFNLIGKAYYSRSFPSGHTLTAFLVATVLICFSRSNALRAAIFIAACLVGLSRVWLGVHWFIDILVGGALGVLSGLLSVYFCNRTIRSVPDYVLVFGLCLFSITSLSALIEANDYWFAQALISTTATLALWRTFSNYIRPAVLGVFTKAAPSKTNNYNDHRLVRFFYITLAVLTLYRILVLLQPHLSLFYDEAYYYHWSLEPAFGYYSKPPFVAWLISLGTLIAGHSVLGVKLAAPVLYSASALVIYHCGQKIASKKSGVIAGLVFISSTVIGFNSVFITTDAPLIFFWSLSIYMCIRCLDSGSLKDWFLLGMTVGMGMLSKYTMAALPLAVFLFMLSDNKYRLLLTQYKPWLAAVIAGAIFSLNLWWNSEHGWIAFLHTSEISQQGKNGFNISGFLEFALGQIFVFGPIWAYLIIRIALRVKNSNAASEVSDCRQRFKDIPKLLLFISLGILALISIQAITSRAFINWAAPWVVACSILIGVYSKTFNNIKWLRIGLLTHLLLLSAFYHWPQLLNHLQIEQSRKNNPYQRLAGWDQVASKLKPILEQHPDALLASDSRDLLAYLGFHALPGQPELVRWNPNSENIRDHYDLHYNMRQYSGSVTSFIFVTKKALAPSKLARFDQSTLIANITEQVYVDKARSIFVYHLSGFNGYE